MLGGTVAVAVAAIAVLGASTTAPPVAGDVPWAPEGTDAEPRPPRHATGDAATAPGRDADDPSVDDPTVDDPAADDPPPAVDDPDPLTAPLARLGDLELWVPGEDPVVVGFHEAAHVSAEAVVPVGVLIEDHNTTRTDLPADDPAGPAYLVMSSRGRAAGPTSAIDVVLEEGTEVRAPVTGTVADVRTFVLYGSHEDVRIEIVPDARPDLRLVIIHLDGARVEVGDRVVGGVTVIAATARSFPFSSHIDRETEPERHPHVHLELQPIDRPRPGDGPAEDGGEDEGADGDERGPADEP